MMIDSKFTLGTYIEQDLKYKRVIWIPIDQDLLLVTK